MTEHTINPNTGLPFLPENFFWRTTKEDRFPNEYYELSIVEKVEQQVRTGFWWNRRTEIVYKETVHKTRRICEFLEHGGKNEWHRKDTTAPNPSLIVPRFKKQTAYRSDDIFFYVDYSLNENTLLQTSNRVLTEWMTEQELKKKEAALLGDFPPNKL